MNRDPTTIAKEIKKHLEVKETGCGVVRSINVSIRMGVSKHRFAERNGAETSAINVPDAIYFAKNMKSKSARDWSTLHTAVTGVQRQGAVISVRNFTERISHRTSTAAPCPKAGKDFISEKPKQTVSEA